MAYSFKFKDHILVSCTLHQETSLKAYRFLYWVQGFNALHIHISTAVIPSQSGVIHVQETNFLQLDLSSCWTSYIFQHHFSKNRVPFWCLDFSWSYLESAKLFRKQYFAFQRYLTISYICVPKTNVFKGKPILCTVLYQLGRDWIFRLLCLSYFIAIVALLEGHWQRYDNRRWSECMQFSSPVLAASACSL